jgi:glycogen phosphorylase
VAYFSAEFGFHETLPIAAGGLGILAGDHAKSASDLDIGFVGISLFYREGYFQQQINQDNWQTNTTPCSIRTTCPWNRCSTPRASRWCARWKSK